MNTGFINAEIERAKVDCSTAISALEMNLTYRLVKYQRIVEDLKIREKPHDEEEEIIGEIEDAIKGMRKFAKEVNKIQITIGGEENV